MGERRRETRWDRLFRLASEQDGVFTAKQAGVLGFYRQLLQRYVEFGRVRRLRRGVYRLVHYPATEHEELAVIWLWSDRAGVFSHDTALSLHGLSDVLPKRVHLSVPSEWRRRRIRVPRDVVLHHATILPEERAWVGAVPVTDPGRTLLDCAQGHLSPELLIQAIEEARTRGLVPPDRLAEVSCAMGMPPGAP